MDLPLLNPFILKLLRDSSKPQKWGITLYSQEMLLILLYWAAVEADQEALPDGQKDLSRFDTARSSRIEPRGRPYHLGPPCENDDLDARSSPLESGRRNCRQSPLLSLHLSFTLTRTSTRNWARSWMRS